MRRLARPGCFGLPLFFFLAGLWPGSVLPASDWEDPAPLVPERLNEGLGIQVLARSMIDSVARSSAPGPLSGASAAVAADPLESATPTIKAIARAHVEVYRADYRKGRYDRSLARDPENLDQWRSEPDITNPGADLANFPNSAFTLPQGRAYIEFTPATWYGGAPHTAPQFNAQFLLRYGVTDDIELRLFGNGASWKGGRHSSEGFSPIAFDTKIHLLDENQDLMMPAVGFEAYLQTELLGSQGFDQGTTGGFTFNFDQSLPLDLDLEYNLGSSQISGARGESFWQFNFQWALQKDILDGDAAVFVHGFWNDMTLPRLPRRRIPDEGLLSRQGNPNHIAALGGGALWTINTRLVVWAQASGGLTYYSPSVITDLGLALAF